MHCASRPLCLKSMRKILSYLVCHAGLIAYCKAIDAFGFIESADKGKTIGFVGGATKTAHDFVDTAPYG